MKRLPIRTELTVPAQTATLPLVLSYVQHLTDLAELSAEDSDALVLAVEEACMNSIEHGYGSEQSGDLTLLGELEPQALCICVRDRGLPFDQTVAPVYRPPADIDSAQPNLEGLGLELIKRAVDEVRWINHGSQGKEMRLLKYLSPKDVVTSEVEEPCTERCCGESQPASSRYLIRRMLPEDALRVCQCFYRTFGYSYDKDLYSPERLISLNETGELVSVVAVDEGSCEIVGHVALVRPKGSLVGERTHLVVSPNHRGQRLRERMGAFLESELGKLGMVGTYGLAVTTHTISQKASESRGMRVCGIDLGLGQHYQFNAIRPSGESDTTRPGLARSNPDRESLVFYFKYLVSAPKAIVHAPARHRQMLARIYENLDAPVQFQEAKQPTGHGLVTVSYMSDEAYGEIQVDRAGMDSVPEIRRARRDLCEIGGAEMVYLDLPLAQAGTVELCEAAEEDGFVFSGIQPCFAPDGDFLRLVYLNVPLDLSRLQIFSPFGRELLDYIRKEIEERRKAA